MNAEDIDAEFDKLSQFLKEIAPRIGELVIVFNSLEESINAELVEMINQNDETIGHVVISGMSFSAKVDLFGQLYRCMFVALGTNDLVSRLDALIVDLKDAARKRNEAVHGAWLDYDVKSLSVKTKTKVRKDGVKHIQRRVALTDIEADQAFIESVEERLEQFIESKDESLR